MEMNGVLPAPGAQLCLGFLGSQGLGHPPTSGVGNGYSDCPQPLSTPVLALEDVPPRLLQHWSFFRKPVSAPLGFLIFER